MIREDPAARAAAIVGHAHVITDADALWTYGYDATMGYRGRPAVVAAAHTEADVAALVRLAAEERMPCLARGGATSLAAGTVPPDGAFVIDLNAMRAVRRLDVAKRRATVEPGAVTREFRTLVAAHGLLYPPDPSSEAAATIGGNVATNAGGPSAFKYGVTRDFVRGLRLVGADGEIHALARPREGPLIDLIVGSEGTLGIVTEIEVDLLEAPVARSLHALTYADDQAALESVPRIIEAGLIPAKLEYLDGLTMEALERARPRGLPREAGGLLLVELDGTSEEVRRDGERLRQVLVSEDREGRVASAGQAGLWWQARTGITASLGRIRPAKIGEDICVPRTRLATTVRHIRREAGARHLPVAIFGHAADGTLHPNMLYDPAVAREVVAAREMLQVVAESALSAGGVLSGEHGLGRVKRPFVATAYDAPTLNAMRRIKHAFDPAGWLNTGAMWPQA
jgi:glycolate oxidase